MKCVCIIFTYSKDAGVLRQSVESMRELHPNIALFIVDDGLSPLKQTMIDWVESQGASYKRTIVNRGMNLNGLDWVRTQLKVMVEAGRESKADIVIKIDSDTLLLKLGRLLVPFNNSSIMACGGRAESIWGESAWLFGACVAYRLEALEKASQEMCKIAEYLYDGIMIQPRGVPEDKFISRLVMHLYGLDSLHIHDFNMSGGLFVGYRYDNAKVGLTEYVKKWDVITFGNLFDIKESGDKKAIAADRMELARKLFREKAYDKVDLS